MAPGKSTVRLDTLIMYPGENLCVVICTVFASPDIVTVQRWPHFSVGFAASAG